MRLTDFLAWLYGHCESNLVETRALPARRQEFHRLGDWPAVEAWCQRFKDENLYVSVATRNGGGTKEHIVEIPAVWCDIDFKDLLQAEAKKRLWESPARPSLVVESGGGYHVYWRLKEPATRKDIPRIEALNRQIAAYLNGDPQATDASRILRLPGTLNFKYKPPRQVRAVWQTGMDWNLEDLADALPSPPRYASEPSQASTLLNECVHIRGIEGSHEATKSHTPHEVDGSHTKPHEATGSHKPEIDFSVGHHDTTLFSVAFHLAKGGMSPDNVLKSIEFLALKLDPGRETSKWAREKVKSAFDRVKRGERSIAQAVREWVLEGESHIETTRLHEIPQLATKEDFKAARQEIYRMVDEGLLERTGSKRGSYRIVNPECGDLDPLKATGEEIQVKWPLGVEALFRLLPGNEVVVAGETDAGKTAFLLNFAKLNMYRHEIWYFSSEMGECELRERLALFSDTTLEDWKRVRFKDRAGDFADVIRPDAINIIDFLEIHEEFYKVGKYLKDIHDRLKGGAALVAIQKNPGVNWGLGGQRGMEKARLYLTLCSNFPGGIAKIEKVKNWRNRGENPRGLQKYFRLYNGCQFSETSKWQRSQ
jgi:hypothetical protein